MSDKAEDLFYRIIKAVLLWASFIPRQLLSFSARPLGGIWYAADRRHREIAFNNIKRAYGAEIDYAQCRQLVKANFIQLSRVALELPSLLRVNKKNILSYVEFSGWENMFVALKRRKGVFLFTAHLGNWELMALAGPLMLDLPFHILVRPIDFKPMNRLMEEIRSRTGNIILDKDKSVGSILDLLSKNRIVGILLDQNSSWFEGVYVPFFGRTACTNKGLAMFALRYDVTVLPVFNIRQKNGRYRIIVEPPVSLIRTGDFKNDIVENTALFNRIIEKYVRMAPDNWAWVHRRWRIKPVPKRARKKILGNVDLTFT